MVSDVEITQVYVNAINERELVRYLASGDPLDKAGAYGIQGYAARLDSEDRGLLLQRRRTAAVSHDRVAGGRAAW